jgi:hypothetical protein
MGCNHAVVARRSDEHLLAENYRLVAAIELQAPVAERRIQFR